MSLTGCFYRHSVASGDNGKLPGTLLVATMDIRDHSHMWVNMIAVANSKSDFSTRENGVEEEEGERLNVRLK